MLNSFKYVYEELFCAPFLATLPLANIIISSIVYFHRPLLLSSLFKAIICFFIVYTLCFLFLSNICSFYSVLPLDKQDLQLSKVSLLAATLFFVSFSFFSVFLYAYILALNTTNSIIIFPLSFYHAYILLTFSYWQWPVIVH